MEQGERASDFWNAHFAHVAFFGPRCIQYDPDGDGKITGTDVHRYHKEGQRNGNPKAEFIGRWDYKG